MKTNICILISLLLNTIWALSQGQWTEQWVKGMPSTLSTWGSTSIKVKQDHTDNIYVSVSKPSSGNHSFNLFKLDSTGQQLWSKSGNANITGVTFDNANALYITGFYENTVSVFSATLTSKGGKDIYVVKLDPNGNTIWMKSFGGPGNDEAGGLLITEKQKLILTGTVRSDPDFIDTLIAKDIRCRPFMGSIDTTGRVQQVKIWDTDLFYTSDTSDSRLEFVEPSIDSKGNIYAMWKMADIKIDSELDTIYGWPTSWSYQFELVKFDTLLQITNAHYLGNDYMTEYSGLKVDQYDQPYLKVWESSQYVGSCVRILGFDSLLNQNKNFITPLISDLPYGNYYYKDLTAIGFDMQNNVVTCSHDACDYYGSNPAQHDQHLVLQSFDTSGSQISLKKYALNGKRVFPYDIQFSHDKMDLYMAGYADSTFKFDADSVEPLSVFVIKYKSTLTNVNDDQALLFMSIYPNPSSGIFTIKAGTQKPSSVCIYDVLGNCVLTKTELTTNQEIDLSKHAKGIYFVEISSGNEKIVKKISLQ